MNQEHLQPQETSAKGHGDESRSGQTLTEATMASICAAREVRLARIQGVVCRKLYTEIQEKLAAERAQFLAILSHEGARTKALARYSFVLNPHFFEQKFLGE